MPHKRNPELSEHLGSLARLVRAQHKTLLDSLIHDHERDGRAWKIEWEVIPTACLAVGAALELGINLVENLKINESAMATNIGEEGGMVYSERLMIRLARDLGKQSAHEVIYDLAFEARDSEQPFRELVREDERVTRRISDAELDKIFSGEEALGITAEAVDEVIQKYEQ